MIKIFNATDTDFKTAGNIIINPLHCHEIKKKSLNGWYIEVEIPIKYKEYIEADKLCVVKTKSKLKPQAFRINDSITYTNRKIKFTAEHVMFDSRRYVLLDARPTNLNGQNGLKYVNERTDKTSPFSIDSNVENISTAYFIRKTLLESWQVFEERWGGVFEADNWDISFKQSIGKDNGETIVYGKNMQGFEIFEDWSNVCTKILPVGYDGLLLPEKYLESETQYEIPYTKIVDFQTDLKTEEQTETNLLVELRNNASKYLEENCVPKVSYTVNSNVNNDLEIGDTIKVLHPFVNIFTEVLEYEYDLISEKVKSLTFGNYTRDVKTKFNNIKNTIETIKQTVSKQEITIKEQTNLINSLNKNGYVYIDDNEILILDQLPKEKAKNVWRFGLGGIGFSSKGYEGPFETAITMDGKINADFITTGTMAVDRIESLANFITDTSASIAAIELQQDSITTKVSSVEQSVENITNTEGEATGKNIHLEDSSDDPLVSIKVKGETSQATRSGSNLLTDDFSMSAGGTTPPTVTKLTRQNTPKGLGIVRKITIPANNASEFYSGCRAVTPGATITRKTTSDKYKVSGRIWVKTNLQYMVDYHIYITGAFGTSTFIYNEGLSEGDWKCFELNSFEATIGNGLVVSEFIAILMKNTSDTEREIQVAEAQINDGVLQDWEQYGASPSPDYRSPIENVEGKNKLKNIATTSTVNGITFTVNNDGTIKANGTATSIAQIVIGKPIIGTYKYTGCPTGGNFSNAYRIRIRNAQPPYTEYGTDIGNGAKITFDNVLDSDVITLTIDSGVTVNNLLFKPMISADGGEYIKYNSLEIKDVGENLYNKKDISGTRMAEVKINELNAGTYTLSAVATSSDTDKTQCLVFDATNNKNLGYLNRNVRSSFTFTLEKPTKKLNFYASTNYVLGENDTFKFADIQIEQNTMATPYKPYQEQKEDFPLSEGQKLYKDSYLASDGIHHKRKQYTFTGNETFVKSVENNDYIRFYSPVFADVIKTSGYETIDKFMCTYFERIENYNNSKNCIALNEKRFYITISKNIVTDVQTFKTWLSQNPITVEYELAEEEIVPYTEAQQEAWNKIEQLHTYKNVTNIFSDTELDIVYVRDNGLSGMYETKQNASKNYTKTSTEIQQLDDSIKRTISQIGDRSQKTTTVTEDIDGIKNEVSKIQDLTQTTSGTKTIVLSNCAKGNLLKLQIKGNNTVFKYLYPSNNLYPANNLLPMGDSRILVNDIQYELGVLDTLRQNGEVYDEFVLENGQAKVIRRINTDGTVKTEEMTEDLGKLSISLNDGTNIIKVLNYSAEIIAKYATKNNYTDIFATKVEMSSSIEQTAEGINQVVRKKVDEDEIISKINQSAEEVEIDANRININGAVSANGNFKVDTERKHEM